MELPRPTWDEFTAQFMARWKQGEHVFINGQTGSGKTELGLILMNLKKNNEYLRKHVAFFVTKPRDPIFKSPLVRGFKRVTTFTPKPGYSRLLIAPRNGDSSAEQVGEQQVVFTHALDKMYADGGWTVEIDETFWLSTQLGLGKHMERGAFMGRALGLTFVFATQRPKFIPVIIPQSCSHAFIGKTGHKGDLGTLAELHHDPRELQAAISSLRSQHEFVYIDVQGKLPMQIVDTRR